MNRGNIVMGGVYTLARAANLGGTLYTYLYDGGQFVNIRIVGADDGRFVCATRDEGGNHLGPGNLWVRREILKLRPDDLEPLQTLD